MAIYIYWFVLALLLLGLELATGTFYLLVASIALAVGGVAALLDVSIPWQLIASAMAMITGTLLLRRWKYSQPGKINSTSLDIGHAVQVLKWNENGTARVLYRGAEWDAEPESADMPRDGTFYIAAVHGSNLVLTHHKPQQN